MHEGPLFFHPHSRTVQDGDRVAKDGHWFNVTIADGDTVLRRCHGDEELRPDQLTLATWMALGRLAVTRRRQPDPRPRLRRVNGGRRGGWKRR